MIAANKQPGITRKATKLTASDNPLSDSWTHPCRFNQVIIMSLNAKTRLTGGNRPCQFDPTATVATITTALPGCGRPRLGGAPKRVNPAISIWRGLRYLAGKMAGTPRERGVTAGVWDKRERNSFTGKLPCQRIRVGIFATETTTLKPVTRRRQPRSLLRFRFAASPRGLAVSIPRIVN